MRKKLLITAYVEIDDVDVNEIKRDLEQEISCASHTYEVLSVEEVEEK